MSSPQIHPSPVELHSITKRFGNLIALDAVSLAVHRGRITTLLGENGAGKTTLMRIAFGLLQPDSGFITVEGQRRGLASPADAIAAGIGMVHQQFSLIPAMTVAENVALGGSGRYSFDKVAGILADIAERTGLTLDPRRRVAELGSADRQKLEIIRTLAHNARVMILDEPTAVLTPKDTEELFTHLKEFARGGGAVVLITHKLADAIAHADGVTVLRKGRVVLSSEMGAVNETSLAEAMLGSAPLRVSAGTRQSSPSSAPIASLTNAVLPNDRMRQAVTLDINPGEIVGIAALDGAAIPLLRVLAGLTDVVSGKAVLPSSVGFVPENRRDEALIGEFTLTENFALGRIKDFRGTLSWNSFERGATEVVSDFSVRTPGVDVSPDQLSGGNQQRFVLGRELHDGPQLLILENPTQGLDVNATSFIHERLRQSRNTGTAIVFYSSDLDELAELSDRVFVVSARGLTAVGPDRSKIGMALLGTQQVDAR